MMIYGYAKGYFYTGDGTLMIKVRIPSIHGPYKQENGKNKSAKSYTVDGALPYYPSLLLPHLPNEGEVVLLASMDNTSSNLIVLGLTGGSYTAGITDNQR